MVLSQKDEAGEAVESPWQACLNGDREQSHLDWTFSSVATPSPSEQPTPHLKAGNPIQRTMSKPSFSLQRE
jgi:hypothetical protein